MFDPADKVALIAGGSRGLGHQIVLEFRKAGADEVISSCELDACEEVAAEVTGMGRRALPYACHAGALG